MRQYCANYLNPPENPDQDIENGIQILHSTQILYSKDTHFFVGSNTLLRMIWNQRVVRVGNGLDFDMVQMQILHYDFCTWEGNTSSRAIRSQQIMGDYPGFVIKQALVELEMLQGHEDQQQRRLPLVEKKVRKRRRVFCFRCQFQTGIKNRLCVRCKSEHSKVRSDYFVKSRL